MNRASRFAWAVLYLFAFAFCCQSRGDDSSSLSALLDQYRLEAKRDVPADPKERERRYQQWSQRLFAAAIEHPEDKQAATALRFALQTSNAIGDNDFSIEIATRLVPLQNDDPMVHTQLGSLLATRFEKSGDVEDRVFALKELEIANTQLLAKADRPIRPDRFAAEQLVINQFVIATLQGSEGSSVKAAASYGAARTLTAKYSLERSQRLTGFDIELLMQRQASALLDSGDLNASDSLIDELCRTAAIREPSLYLLPYAERRFKTDRKGLKTFLQLWSGRLTGISQCRILIELARAYYEDEEYEHALPLFERLSIDFQDILLKLDHEVLAKGLHGSYGYVLYHLGDLYRRKGGMNDKALDAWQRFVSLYPNDSETPHVLALINDLLREKQKSRVVESFSRPNTSWFVPIVTINVILVLAVTGVFLMRRMRRSLP